jgi:radical SAM superfamily enzyme YgiQ (UPF0313 family)
LFRTYGVTNIYFHDDDFCQDPEWLASLCARLIHRALPVRWSCAARVENLSSGLLHTMREAGCRQIGVGIETASSALLRWLQKGSTADRISEGVARIHRAGLRAKVYVIIGTPAETFSDLMDTVRLLARLRVAHVQVSYFTPLPGSPAYHRRPIPASKWPLMNLLHPVGDPSLPAPILKLAEFGIYATSYSSHLLGSMVPLRRLRTAEEFGDG